MRASYTHKMFWARRCQEFCHICPAVKGNCFAVGVFVSMEYKVIMLCGSPSSCAFSANAVCLQSCGENILWGASGAKYILGMQKVCELPKSSKNINLIAPWRVIPISPPLPEMLDLYFGEHHKNQWCSWWCKQSSNCWSLLDSCQSQILEPKKMRLMCYRGIGWQFFWKKICWDSWFVVEFVVLAIGRAPVSCAWVVSLCICPVGRHAKGVSIHPTISLFEMDVHLVGILFSDWLMHQLRQVKWWLCIKFW